LGSKEVVQIVKVLSNRIRFRVDQTLMFLSQFIPAKLRDDR
jgi:hypothetical protein